MRKKQALLRCVLILLLIGWVCMLHLFSGQSAEDSAALSGGICRQIAQLTVKDFDSLPATEQAAVIEWFQTPVRKTAHFCEYGLGGVLAAILLLTVSVSGWLRWLIGGGFGLLNAVLDEWHQGFVAGRAPGFGDVVLDLMGFLCGMVVLMGLVKWWQKRHSGR